MVAIAVVGIVVGIIAHLILGSDGYSWFGEIILGFAGATIFGLFVGILAGARNMGIDGFLAGTGPLNFGIFAQILVAAAVGAVIFDGIAIWLTFRSTGRGFGQSAQ
jgi:uncharacterized membrane protein YeaQ/YmgE (transglycosylase-associated protein family)